MNSFERLFGTLRAPKRVPYRGYFIAPGSICRKDGEAIIVFVAPLLQDPEITVERAKQIIDKAIESGRLVEGG